MKRGGHVSAGYLQPAFTQCTESSSSRQEHRNVATNTSAATPLGTQTPPAISHEHSGILDTQIPIDIQISTPHPQISRYLKRDIQIQLRNRMVYPVSGPSHCLRRLSDSCQGISGYLHIYTYETQFNFPWHGKLSKSSCVTVAGIQAPFHHAAADLNSVEQSL